MDVLPLDNGGIRFLEMPGAFYEQLARLPEMCEPSDDAAIARRLSPHPIDPEEEEAVREAAEADWSEYVRPEMEAAFDLAMRTVLQDLAVAKRSDDRVDDDTAIYQVEIPGENVAAWFQVLNRARIVLALRHSLPVTEPSGSSGETLTLTRLLAAHLSEHYAEILEILVYQMQRDIL